MINDVIAYYFEQYVSEDYLGRLDPYPKTKMDHRQDHLGRSSVNNDNGILFLAMGFLLLNKMGKLPVDAKERAAGILAELEVLPGIFNRVPGGTKEEKHDNYIGILILDQLFDLGYAKKINNYGLRNFYNYNNKEPGKWVVRFQRQGGDIGIYQLCAKSFIFPFFLLWFAVGLWIGAWKKYPSSINLGWTRLELMKISLKKQKWRLIARLQVFIAEKIFNLILKKKQISLAWSFSRYFKKDHPIHQFLTFIK